MKQRVSPFHLLSSGTGRKNKKQIHLKASEKKTNQKLPKIGDQKIPGCST